VGGLAAQTLPVFSGAQVGTATLQLQQQQQGSTLVVTTNNGTAAATSG
jgi:phosphosulfolactate phosphohydrolase-like enzyme